MEQVEELLSISVDIMILIPIVLDKIEVVNRLKKELAYETVKNYTIDYDRTWIFDKIQ